MNFYVARRNTRMMTLPMDRMVILPGVTDPSEIRDLAQAVLSKQGKDYHLADKYIEQSELDHEYRLKVEMCQHEIKRRLEGQLKRPVDKFIPPKVI